MPVVLLMVGLWRKITADLQGADPEGASEEDPTIARQLCWPGPRPPPSRFGWEHTTIQVRKPTPEDYKVNSDIL